MSIGEHVSSVRGKKNAEMGLVGREMGSLDSVLFWSWDGPVNHLTICN